MKSNTFVPLAVGLAAILVSSNSQAALLNLTAPSNYPDFFLSFVGVQYDAGTRTFQASGYTASYSNGSATLVGDPGVFSLTAQLTPSYQLQGGSFSLSGDIGNGDQLLLSGSLRPGTDGGTWGFQDPGGSSGHDLFEFTFNNIAGELALDFTQSGNVGGIIIDAEFDNGGTPFTGNWTQSFSNDGFSGGADCFVPEPSTYALGAALVAGASLWSQRRRNGPKGLRTSH